MTGALTCLDITVSAGTVTFTSTGTLAISGSMSLVTGTIWSATGTITFNATTAKTITTNAVTISATIIFNGVGGTWQLLDALTLDALRTTTVTNGTLDINGKTLTTGAFTSNTSLTRTIAFGTGNINCISTSSAFIIDFTTVLNLTITGTPVINISNNSSNATVVANGGLTEANSISYNFTTGTYALTFLGTANYTAKNIDFTGFAGTWNATALCTIYGNLKLSTGMTLTASASAMRFLGTTATQFITTNVKTLDFPITVTTSGSGSVQLLDAMTVGATRTFTFSGGAFDLNGKTLTTGLFSSTGSTARTLAFGTGNIDCNAAGGTLWTTAIVTNLTVTGTPVVNISNSGAVATSVLPGILTEANSISFNFTTGAYALTFLGTANYAAKSVDFTGFAGTWAARTVASTIYGNLTLSTGMTFAASSGVLTFGATSGTQILTSNAITIDEPLTFNGVGGTVKLADALIMGATRTLGINNGTFDGDNKTISGAALLVSNLAGGTPTIKNISTAVQFTLTNATLLQGGPNTVGTFLYTSGNLNISNYQLTCSTYTAATGNVRTITCGTGNITVINTAGGTICSVSGTSLTRVGNVVVNISNNSSNATVVSTGTLTEANAYSFNFINGNYLLTFLSGNSTQAFNVDFTGFSGTFNTGITGTAFIYGNLTLSSSPGFIMSAGGSNVALAFSATSGVQTVTSNGASFGRPLNVNGVGGTVRLADAMLMVSTQGFTHTNGTLDLNGMTLTLGTASTSYATAAGTKDLTFNGGTLVCPAVTTTAFNNAAPTNFTTTAGTGTGKISMTGATAKTFVGGGATYNCTLSNDGAGALTISGSNTFTTIANSVQPTAFTFTAGTTQTVTNWNVSGTAGNLVTIISSTASVPALLSKASGTVSSDYLSLKDSTALGGAAWYAGANSTNVSGNLGWIFTAAPTGGYTITALNGSYAISGQSISLYRSRLINSNYGSYALSGQSAGMYKGYTVLALNGSYALSGRSAVLSRGFLLSSQNGLYSLTGQAIDISYTPAPPVTGPTQYFIEIRSFTESRRI